MAVRTRCWKLSGVTALYCHPKLRPGRYRVVLEEVADMWGPMPTITCQVVLYRGKLYRCSLH